LPKIFLSVCSRELPRKEAVCQPKLLKMPNKYSS